MRLIQDIDTSAARSAVRACEDQPPTRFNAPNARRLERFPLHAWASLARSRRRGPAPMANERPGYPRTPLPTPCLRLRSLTAADGLGFLQSQPTGPGFKPPSDKPAALTVTQHSAGDHVPAFRSTCEGLRIRDGLAQASKVPTLAPHPLRPLHSFQWWEAPVPARAVAHAKAHRVRRLPTQLVPDRPSVKAPDELREHFKVSQRVFPYRTQRLAQKEYGRWPSPQPWRNPYIAPFVAYTGQGASGMVG